MAKKAPNNIINQVRKLMLHIAISLFIVIWLFLSTLKSNAQTTPNNALISGMNSVSVYYHFGWNSFAWMFFRWTGKVLSTWEKISIAGSNISVTCKSKLDWYYYNNSRWLRLRPLDTSNLNLLIGQDASYNTMTITGWFFTDCTGTNITVKTNEIYGQIKHNIWGVDYYVTAGTDYNFTTNTIWTNLSWSMLFTWGNAKWYVFDNNGWIWELWVIAGSGWVSNGNTSVSQCINFIKTQQSWSNITLTCTWNNVNQYILNLFTSTWAQYAGIIAWWWASYTRSINNIATWNYTASCTTMIWSNTCPILSIDMSTGWSTNLSGIYYSGARFINSIWTIEHARLKRLYTSEIFEIQWIWQQVPISLTKWFLYINGTWVWTTWLVNNGDRLQIELISSDEYETTVSTNITISGLTGTFTITTMNPNDEVCQLTKDEQTTIQWLFDSIKSWYNDAKRNNLLYIMKSMIKDVQDFDYNCSLQYLQDLADQNINNEETSTHTAPNCKEYPITVNTDKWWYTSTKFKKIQYFATREALIRFIDSKNPGDCKINTYNAIEDYENTDETKHVAPNGKVYEITESDWLFSSPTITTSSKKFDNRDALLSYIDRNNPTIEVWDHNVDTGREPITYATQNNKEYKIYKTDKWYMSYKLIKPKYFDNLEEIESYIDRNNR